MNAPVHILIVEDLDENFVLAQHEICKSVDDCEFLRVDTQDDFIKAVETFKPDVILSDYTLSKFDGMKVLDLMRNHAPFTPVIIWSQSLGEDIAVDCMKAGANNYIIRENIKRLGPVVLHALEERRLWMEQQNTQVKLHESEKRLHLALDASNLGVWEWRLSDNSVYWTENVYRMTGLWDFDNTLDGFTRIIHPDDAPRVMQGAQKAIEQGEVFITEFRMIRPDGSISWFRDYGQIERDENGKPLRLVGTVEDITERKQWEKKLRRSEEFLHGVQNSFSAHIAILDRDGVIVQVNSAWRAFGAENGLSHPDACVGMNYLEVCDNAKGVDSEGADVVASLIREVMNGERVEGIVEYPCHSSKEMRWFVLRITRFNDGNRDWIVLVHENATLQKDAELTIRNLARIPEENPNPIIRTDKLGRILYTNTGGRDFLTDWNVTVGDLLPDHWRQIALDAFHNNKKTTLEVKAGEKCFSTLFVPIQETGYINLYGRDVTERKRSEQVVSLLSEFQKQLVSLDHINDLYQLVGGTICKMIGDCYLIVSGLDEDARAMRVVGIYGFGSMFNKWVDRFKLDPTRFSYSLDDMTEDELRLFRSGNLEKFEHGLYRLLLEKVPKALCNRLEKELNLTGIYTMGFMWQDMHLGGVTILARSDLSFLKETIESMVRQSSIVIHRLRTEEALRTTEIKYRNLVERLPVVVYTAELGITGNWMYVSPQIESLLGFTPEEWMNDPELWYRQIHPDDSQKIRTLEESTYLKGGTVISEYRINRKDGEEIWIRDIGNIVYSPDVALPVVQGTLTDITEMKQAEEKLRSSEERFRQLVDNIQEVFWMTDAVTGQEVYISPAAKNIWGRSAESMQEDSNIFIDSILPEDRDFVMKALAEQRSGKRTDIEYRIVRTDGTVHWIWDRAFPIFDSSGKVVRMAGIAADITERKQAGDLIKKRNRMLLSLRQVAIELGSELRLPVLLHTILEQVVAMLDADRGGGVYLYEEAENMLRLVHGAGINKDRDEVTIPVGVGVAGRVFETSQTLVIDDYTHWEGHSDVLVEDPPSTVMGVPLFLGGKVIGVLTLIANSHGRRFNQQDVQQVEMFAAQAAVAIQNARLYQRAAQELLEREQAEDALRKSEERFRELVSIAPVGVAVYVDDKLVFVNAAGAKIIGAKSPDELIGRPIIDFIHPDDRAQPQSSLRNMANGESGWYPHEGRLVRLDGSVVPVDVTSTMLNYMGRPAVQVIVQDITERKRIEADAKRHLAQMQALYENGLAVGQLLDPYEIGERIIRTFSNYLSWHHVTIRLLKDDDTLELVAVSMSQTDSDVTEDEHIRHRFSRSIMNVGQGVSGWVVQSGIPIRTGNVLELPQYIAVYEGMLSGLYMPLIVGNNVIGVISVESEKPDAFTEQDERLLATLANQAAVAFENARLYQSVQNELQERNRVERALRSSETHYRELADSVTDVFFELDQNMRYTHWNKASEALTGVPEKEAIGKSMTDIFGDSEEQTRIGSIYEKVLTTQNPRTFETSLMLNHERHSFEINAYPSRRGVAVLAKDVTERRQSEIILQKRFELMEYSAHHSLDELMSRTINEACELTRSKFAFFHFVEADQNTLGMQSWSDNVVELFSVPEEAGKHLSLDQAGLWADAARQRRPIIQNDYESQPGRRGLPQGHAEIVREMVIPIIRNEKLVAVMGVANKLSNYTQQDLETAERLADYAWDITERKRMEMVLADERNQLAKRVEERTSDLIKANSNLARALRVKDEFLANMSHELRTPLNAILGLSESLFEQIAGPLNEKQLKYITTIGESGHHLLSLINDILDLAKIEAGQITLDINKVDIRSVCQASLRMIKQLAQKKQQDVHLDIDGNVGLIWADERRLKQMIVNLLSNAVKFTPEHGTLKLEVRGSQQDNQVAISVIDNGIGIREEDIARLFKPFVQLDSGLARESTGTGLGLALVAQMARLHGGSVSVTSQPDEGSCFSIKLPWEPMITKETVERMMNTGKLGLSKNKESSKKNILLIEDTDDVIMMVKDYLETAGYAVTTARDGIEGLEQAEHMKPDLILMDIQMPRMDGIEAARKIRENPRLDSIPIIALTALAMPNDRERCMEAGMNEYVSKPVNLRSLVKIIQKFLSQGEENTRPI